MSRGRTNLARHTPSRQPSNNSNTLPTASANKAQFSSVGSKRERQSGGKYWKLKTGRDTRISARLNRCYAWRTVGDWREISTPASATLSPPSSARPSTLTPTESG